MEWEIWILLKLFGNTKSDYTEDPTTAGAAVIGAPVKLVISEEV